MSIGAPSYSQIPPITGTAPDTFATVRTPGCRSLTLQIQNQGIEIQFGRGPQGAEIWDLSPEPYFPVVGSISPDEGFDAVRWRALVPAAQIPTGTAQAYVILTPRR